MDVDGTCLAVAVVAGDGSFQGGEGKRADIGVGEDLVELSGLQKLEWELF